MATYYYNAQATGANNGSSKTDAFTTYAAFVAAMNQDGDIGYHHAASQETLLGGATYTFQASVSVFCIDFDTDALTDPYDVDGYIGDAMQSCTLQSVGAQAVYLSHLVIKITGATGRWFTITSTTSTLFRIGVLSALIDNTNTGSDLRIGAAATNGHMLCVIDKLRWRRGSTAHNISVRAAILYINSFSVLGSNLTFTPAIFFATSAGAEVHVKNADWSNLGTGTNIVNRSLTSPASFRLENCKLPENYVLLNTLSSTGIPASGNILAYDCAVGDSHINFHYANAFGEVVVDTGKYAGNNVGDTDLSWKITTTDKVNRYTPFAVPPIPRRHRTTGAVTPWFAIAREDSASAFTNGEVWAEFSAKETDASVIMTVKSDKAADLATPANQTTDADTAWTGLGGTNWKGKVGEQAFTVAEHGFIQGQLYVGLANAELRLDPQVRI